MQIAHKIEITPNNAQKTYLNKCFGVSRFVFNWGLAEWNKQYKEGLKPNGLKLKKEFNSIKKEQFPWTKEVTKWAAQQPFLNLQKSFDGFFKKKSGYPKFKKRGKTKDSFYIVGSCVKVEGEYLKIPVLDSKIKMTEELRFLGKINSAVISRKSDRFFVSFQMEIPDKKPELIQERSVGIDVGIKSLFVLSDGLIVNSINPLKNKLRRLKRLQRKFSKTKKGSNNFLKLKTKISRLYLKVSNLRKDILHKVTTFLVRNYQIIKVEDLNLRGMLKNHKLARAISDLGLGEFVRQLIYKCKVYGRELVFADRFFPSSKMCSDCGAIKKDLTLKDRVYFCDCGNKKDRDFNASLNINKIGRAPTEFTPVEITALQNKVFPYFVSSIRESGI